MFGYKINRGYTKLTIWEFNRKTKSLVGTETFTPDKKRTRFDKYTAIAKELWFHRIKPHAYEK